VRDREAVISAIETVFANVPSEELLVKLDNIGVPAGRVRDLGEVYTWDQVRSQGLLIEVEHAALGRVVLPGPALRFDDASFAGGVRSTSRPQRLTSKVRQSASGSPRNHGQRVYETTRSTRTDLARGSTPTVLSGGTTFPASVWRHGFAEPEAIWMSSLKHVEQTGLDESVITGEP